MRIAWLTIENALGTVDTGNAAVCRPLRLFKGISQLRALLACRCNRLTVSPDPSQYFRRRTDKALLNPFDTLNILVPVTELHRQPQRLPLVLNPQLVFKRSVTTNAKYQLPGWTDFQRLLVEPNLAAGWNLCPDEAALGQGALQLDLFRAEFGQSPATEPQTSAQR